MVERPLWEQGVFLALAGWSARHVVLGKSVYTLDQEAL